MKSIPKPYRNRIIALAGAALTLNYSFAAPVQQQAAQTKTVSAFHHPVFTVMFITCVLLALVIIIMAQAAKAAIQVGAERRKAARENNNALKALLTLMTLGCLSADALAQADQAISVVPVATKTTSGYWGMDAATFYMMSAMILFELIVIWKFYTVTLQQLGYYERRERIAAEKKAARTVVRRPSFLEKMNRSVAIEKEGDIMLDHDYDGIRELDNNLPPWWKYGFYVSIVFAVIYLFHFHVMKTGRLQAAEYDQELLQAKYALEDYRKKAANLVDEHNATLLTDASSLASGKALFNTNCAACHGAAGEGGVGPNLTDDYWLHGGDIKDVFSTIKYGYPEMGMKSWQQDLGARQIHEVASFVKSLRGTNPANAREAQGELYTETADSTGVN